jgi:hypothetical protein
MADERKRRKRKEIVFAFDGEVNVEDIVAMRRANDVAHQVRAASAWRQGMLRPRPFAL